MVTRIDRLARSLKDLQDIVHELKAKGVALKATEQPIDTGTAAGKAFLDMLGVFAEFETNLRRERQLEGIQAAKARGVYKGRRPSIDPAEVRRLRDEERLGPSAIARRLGIGRASVYRVLGGRDWPLGLSIRSYPAVPAWRNMIIDSSSLRRAGQSADHQSGVDRLGERAQADVWKARSWCLGLASAARRPGA